MDVLDSDRLDGQKLSGEVKAMDAQVSHSLLDAVDIEA